MGVTALVLAAVMSASVLNSWEIRWFPGAHFDARGREPMQRRAMASWPGPDELLRMWREENLSDNQRIALLLGGAAFHDPILLPAHREALESPSQRIRQAGAYGFHDLMADRTPDVTGEIDDQVAARLIEELDAVSETLRRHSLISLWLQSALASEGSTFPGWRGMVLGRSSRDCLRAAEKLAGVEDLDVLVRAFELSQSQQNRIGLAMLIEAVSLSRFIEMPTSSRQAWGAKTFTDGLAALDAALPSWYGADCSVDGEAILLRNLRPLGVHILDPLSPEGCELWRAVLSRGLPRWWMLAAKRLYACGGPWYELSALDPDSERNRNQREALLGWYQPPRDKAPRPRPAPSTSKTPPGG
jgi:hypothetical protein